MNKAKDKGSANDGLAAYVGISAPETPRYLLANNFLGEYFSTPAKKTIEYHFNKFSGKTLYTEENARNLHKLQNSFDVFLNRYLGNETIHEENSKLNKDQKYYFPLTPEMLTGSSPTLRHMLFYLQQLDEKYDYKEMQRKLESYIFQDSSRLNYILKILLQDKDKLEEKTPYNNNADFGVIMGFWATLTPQERSRVEKLAERMNEDLDVLLTHEYFGKLDFYRRYNYLAILLTSYVIQYIVCRRDPKACLLCQGAPRDSRLAGAIHRASCSNYTNIRMLFPALLTGFYTDALKKNVPDCENIEVLAEEEQVYVDGKEFNTFVENVFGGRRRGKFIQYQDIQKSFFLKEGQPQQFDAEEFVFRYIDLTGTKKGSTLTKISSTLPTSGKQIDMIFPKNNSKQKYFAMSETLTEFYVRLYLARKNRQYDYLDNFIEDLQSRYKIVIVKSREGENMLKSMKISLPAQEYAKNRAAFIDTLTSINCLIKLSDSGYVVTLPEEKGGFRLI